MNPLALGVVLWGRGMIESSPLSQVFGEGNASGGLSFWIRVKKGFDDVHLLVNETHSQPLFL